MKKRSSFSFIDWAFELLVLLLVGVMLLGHFLQLSSAEEEVLAVLVIVGVYGLIAWRWWANPADMLKPVSTEARPGQDRDHLTRVQAHYQQIMRFNSKRK